MTNNEDALQRATLLQMPSWAWQLLSSNFYVDSRLYNAPGTSHSKISTNRFPAMQQWKNRKVAWISSDISRS
jgi:hypothetical protein